MNYLERDLLDMLEVLITDYEHSVAYTATWEKAKRMVKQAKNEPLVVRGDADIEIDKGFYPGRLIKPCARCLGLKAVPDVSPGYATGKMEECPDCKGTGRADVTREEPNPKPGEIKWRPH